MAGLFRIPAPPRLSPIAALGVAIGLPFLTLAFQSAFRPLFEGIPFILFMLAVVLAAWAGGVLPGLLAVVLSAAAGYAFLRASGGPGRGEAAHLAAVVFVPAATVVAAIGAAARAGFRERERATETLRESEARERARAEELHAIMDAVPAVVLIAHDSDGRRMTANRAAHELLRLPPGATASKTAERPPTHYRVLRNGVELAPADLPTQAAARTGEAVRDAEIEISFDDGTHRILLGNAEPLFDESGRARGAISAFVDVTSLSEALRTRDAFLSMASHELKTPLTALQLQVDQLLRVRASLPPVAKAADTIRRQVLRLTVLVNTLLDVSRVNEGRLRMDLERFDLSALVCGVVAGFAAESEADGGRIRLEVSEAVWGRWDRLRLEQVVTNLVSNALKYGEGKPVTVRIERGEGGTVDLVVADQGIGISPDEQRVIFERFERGRGARGYGGFGLGLWIARELVNALGGTIAVESAAGRGATFRVRLPLEAPECDAGDGAEAATFARG